MKKLAILMAVSLIPVTVLADSYTIDPRHTFPHLAIDHLGFSTIYGRFGKTRGTIEMDRANQTGSVEVIIDASSIDTGDRERDDSLRSPDFFNVAESPEITFKSTNVTFAAETVTSVDGELTMLGVTKPITLTVERMNCDIHPFAKKEACGFDATAMLKRSDFGMNYGLPALGDEVKLILGVEAIKN